MKEVIEKPNPSLKSVKNDHEEGIKSVKLASEKLKVEELNNSPSKSQKSNHLQQFLEVEEPKHSERKSVKQSEKASNYEKPQSHKAESVKAESVKPSEKPSFKKEPEG